MAEKKQKIESCEGSIRIDSDGSFQVKPTNLKVCDKILSKLNPISGTYWKRHIAELRDKVKHTDID